MRSAPNGSTNAAPWGQRPSSRFQRTNIARRPHGAGAAFWEAMGSRAVRPAEYPPTAQAVARRYGPSEASRRRRSLEACALAGVQRHFNRKIWTSFAGCLGGSGEVDGVVGRRMGTKWARPPPTGFKSKEGKLLARRRRARAVESFSLSRFVRRGRPPKRTNHSLAGRANEKKDPYPPPIAR